MRSTFAGLANSARWSFTTWVKPRSVATQAEAAAATSVAPVIITERCAQVSLFHLTSAYVSLISYCQLQRINKLREEDPNLCLRLEIDGGGCQGFQYNFKLESVDDIDRVADRCAENERELPAPLYTVVELLAWREYLT